MSLKAEEISKILSEIKASLQYGRIQNIYQPSEYSLTLEIRAGNKNHLLYFSAEPHLSRIHLISEKYPNPSTPYPFCMFLRRHLKGARIEEILQLHDRRIVIIRLAKNIGIGEHIKYNLIAELDGRKGNIILANGDMKILTTALKRGRENMDLVTDSSYELINHILPAHSADQLSHNNISFNVKVAERYGIIERDIKIEKIKKETVQKIKKLEKKVVGLKSDLVKLERYKEDNIKGELLKVNFRSLKRGMQIITVKNYYYQQGDSLLKIELDPSLSPSENIERYFRRYKKYERGKNEILKQINLTKEKIDNLMKNMENKNFLEEHISALSVSFVSKKNEGRSSPRTFRSSDGLTIFVGKNNRQNDELTFRIAKGDDIWLHVRDFPGSHVVIQTGGRKDIPRESLLDAAALAVYFSKLKSAEKGNVIYTLRKYVRKPRGAEAGKVLCSQDKNLFIKLDKKRIERLFS